MKNSFKLQQLINQANNMIKSSRKVSVSDPDFIAWRSSIERYLANSFGKDSIEFTTFHERKFFPQAFIDDDESNNQSFIRNIIEATRKELDEYWAEECEKENSKKRIEKTVETIDYSKVFIVHGHNDGMKEATARLLEQQDIEGIILNEQPNLGKTIIEKIEEFSKVGAAIILLTCDDIGRAKEEEKGKSRARQNVVFEAGYFMGKYGRSKIVLVAEKEIEMPSDLAGVIFSEEKSWKLEVCRELKAMGYNIDLNKLK